MKFNLYNLINYLIALVWLINGLFFKVLHLVPRHEQIVSKILGEQYASILTVFIGFLEIGMAIWILSGIKRRLNVFFQIIIIIIMNIIEFSIASELLLWGKLNLLFAILFSSIIYLNEFHFKK